jgi:nucleotide-binding universal stress UspA family protein
MDEIRKFSKILVGIDGSEHSMKAADYAISLTRVYGSELIALNVITSDVDITTSAASPRMEEIEKASQEYFNKIRHEADNLVKGIKLRTELIISSSVVGGIVEFAEKENIDLIVVGTKGRSGLKKLLLGSVASGIVNYAHCPVMIIK